MKPFILIADDSEADIDLLRLALVETGFGGEIAQVKDGMDAIRVLAAATPSLAIVDIRMPHVDGFQVLEHIRSQERLKRLPVVIMSTSAAESDRQRASALGATEYWVKPSRFEELLDLVRKLPSLCA